MSRRLPVGSQDVPIFVICRDRLTPLMSLLDWLTSAGYHRIVLVDNDSAYPPLLDFYDRTAYTVIRLDVNVGKLSPWSSGAVGRFARGQDYVVTDFDVVPDDECPKDLIAHLGHVLDRYPFYRKVGPALRIDDIPSYNARAEEIVAWESRFWSRPIAGGLFHAEIDTTLALYRANSPFARGPAVRTGFPYVARHLPWYDPPEGDREIDFYRQRAASHITNWTKSGAAPLLAPTETPRLMNVFAWEAFKATLGSDRLFGRGLGRVLYQAGSVSLRLKLRAHMAGLVGRTRGLLRLPRQ